jgi:DsbC/DsbD-like thiol-disulfide interchange protein
MKRLQTAAIALLFLSSAATAATSPWVETPGGDVRLVVLPADAGGSARAMLDIRLHAGWKTYWRDPGGSGIPPSIAVSGATLTSIGFPAPRRLGEEANHYIGYDAPVRLPMTLGALGGTVTATVFLGVRSKRYSMLVEDGVVKALNIEESPGQATVSGAAAMIKQL